MRKSIFVIIFGVVFLLYLLINYYIGIRGWQLIGTHLSFLSNNTYWILFWFISMSYFLGRIGDKFLPLEYSSVLKRVGSYWLAVMYYALLAIIVFDLIFFLGGRINPNLSLLKENMLLQISSGILIFSLTAGIVFYGSVNARNPRIVKYEVSIGKKTETFEALDVVLVSDIHLGTVVDNVRLNEMVMMINSLNPDLVLFAGDVIDEDVEVFAEQQMTEAFKRLESKLGVYAVLGNHEYIGGNIDEAIYYLQQGGIVVLRDSYIKVADSFYIVGRDDKVGVRFTGQERARLDSIMKKIDKTKPIIMLDHHPVDLKEAQEAGVDLQLSGHTHTGQIFPNNLITRGIFDIDWGYLRRGNFQIIVSTGYGTWGPPIRIGNTPELVHIKLRFCASR